MVPLLHRGSTSVDEPSAFQITVSRLSFRSEVLHTELEPTKLDYVASLKSVIVQNRVLRRRLSVFWRFLGFEIPDDHEHHVGHALRGFSPIFRLGATVHLRSRIVRDDKFACRVETIRVISDCSEFEP